jgi:hypothetical protein
MHRNPGRERTYPIVKDFIGWRTDGRPKHAEPLDAFKLVAGQSASAVVVRKAKNAFFLDQLV